HKCLQPHQRGRRLERGVQLHRLPSVRVRDWHKCGFHSRAVLSAACRDNAWPPANEWWRWINRPNNFCRCPEKNSHLLPPDVPPRVSSQIPIRVARVSGARQARLEVLLLAHRLPNADALALEVSSS